VASGRDVTGKGGIRQQLIDAWNARQDREHSDVHARLVELPGSADQQRSQLLGALQSGSAQYDVVNLDVTWVPEFAAAHLIRPLPDDLVDADVIKSVASTARWGGKLYAVPFNSDVGLLYYRRDHLKQAHVQDTDLSKGITWRQLRDLIDAVEAPGRSRPKGYEKGWTTQLGPYEGRTVNGIEAFLSATDGAGLTDESGRYTATVQQLTDGIAELRARTQGAYTLGDAVRSDEGESLTDFADGRTAFLRHWPYAYRTLHQSLSDAQLGVAPLPGRAVLGGQNLALAGSSQRVDKARELIRFQGERTLSARRGVRGHPGNRVHRRRRDLRRGEDTRSGLPLGLALRRERRPHAARRPRASRVRPDDPAPRAPARRPAPPHPLVRRVHPDVRHRAGQAVQRRPAGRRGVGRRTGQGTQEGSPGLTRYASAPDTSVRTPGASVARSGANCGL
jgi:spermidine/putrescine-binding protein